MFFGIFSFFIRKGRKMEKYIKHKMEENRPHAFEKKVLEREMAKGEPRVAMFYQKNQIPAEDLDLAVLRTEMKREGEDITTSEIQEISKIIKVKDHMINIHIYRGKDTGKKKNAVLFIHGGAFFGGDVKTKSNQCRYLAEQAEAVVISPEYRLAPETPFPGPVEDVMGTLDWMTEYAEELKINGDKIAVMGESAGGTLAANCCLRDGKKRIGLAVYIYGALDLTPAEKTPYQWDYSKYEMDEKQKDYIMNRLYRLKELTDYMKELYVQNGYSTKDGDVSPLYAEDLSRMPKTLMVEAEFDYFKICNDEFVKRLTKAGKDAEVILYEGLDHGFFDRLGSLPQAQDCIDEIARRVKAM